MAPRTQLEAKATAVTDAATGVEYATAQKEWDKAATLAEELATKTESLLAALRKKLG